MKSQNILKKKSVFELNNLKSNSSPICGLTEPQYSKLQSNTRNKTVLMIEYGKGI